jgi:hypothetical protein
MTTEKYIIGNNNRKYTEVPDLTDEIIRVANQLDKSKTNSLEKKTKYFPQEEYKDYIYVPSIGLYVAKEKKLLGKTWSECHTILHENNKRMLILPEFLEFLKYTKIKFPDIYNEITQVTEPWRSEWLDADLKLKDNKLYINSNHKLNENGSLVPLNSEIIDKNTLMQDKTPGISLDDYIIKAHTSQGLPSKDVASGDLYYYFPRSANNSVAGFDAYSGRAYLNCNRDPPIRDSNLGVRAVLEIGENNDK